MMAGEKAEGPMPETQPYLAQDDPRWIDALLALFWAISSRDFSKRQKRLLFFILKQSFGRSRGKAYVSSLESFDEYTRMHMSHISETLGYLKAARVIAEYPAGCYGFRFPISDWDQDIKVLPERIYLEEQLALIPVPPDLEDALREVFIDDIKNLPTRNPVTGVVHPDRSRSSSGPSSPMGGVVSRESVGSVPDDQAAATTVARGPLLHGRAPTSSEKPGEVHSPQSTVPQSFPDSGNGEPPRPSSGPFPESGNIGGFASKLATAKAFPDSGNGLHYCSTGNAPTEHYYNDISTKGFPDSGKCEPHGRPQPDRPTGKPAMQHCNNAPEASRKKKFSAEQQELFDELEALRGNGKKALPVFGVNKEWFGFWVLSVRDRFEITQELVGDLKYKMLTDVVDDPGAWMMFKWKSWGRPKRR